MLRPGHRRRRGGPRADRRRGRRLPRRPRRSRPNAPVETWFRNSGTTQYGGHAHIVMPAVTGSAATGPGLGRGGPGRARYGARERARAARRTRSSSCSRRPPRTWSAENTRRHRRARPGAARLGPALRLRPARPRARARADRRRPDPAAGADHVARSGSRRSTLERRRHRRRSPARVGARAARSRYRARSGRPASSRPRPSSAGRRDAAAGARSTARSATIDLAAVRAALDAAPRRRRGRRPDRAAPRAPATPTRTSPRSPSASRVTDAAGNRGEDRKVLFAYRDATLHAGWPRHSAGGGEASQRLCDVDGDNRLDVVLADSSGDAARARTPTARRWRASTAGSPCRTRPLADVHAGAPAFDARRRAARAAAHARDRRHRRRPAAGDRRHRRRARVRLGARRLAPSPGFPVRLNPDFSRPAGPHAREPRQARLHRLAGARRPARRRPRSRSSPPRIDQHVYAWDGSGRRRARLPGEAARPEPPRRRDHHHARGRRHRRRRPAGARHADPGVRRTRPQRARGRPRRGCCAAASPTCSPTRSAAPGAPTRSTRAATCCPAGRSKPNGAVPDALPLVGPGVEHALANVDGDPQLEVIGNVASGDVQARDGDGSRRDDLRPGARHRRARRQGRRC